MNPNKDIINVIYKKDLDGTIRYNNPTKYLKEYLGSQGVVLKDNIFVSPDEANNGSLNTEIVNDKEQIDSL